MIDPGAAGARELASAIRSRETSSAESVDWVLDRIRRHGEAVNAVITRDKEGVRGCAREADAALDRAGLAGPYRPPPGF